GSRASSLEYGPQGGVTMQRRQFNKALAAAGALAAVSPFGIVRAQAQKLKVGVILPRSGYLGFIGQSCQKGADLAPGVIKALLGELFQATNTIPRTAVFMHVNDTFGQAMAKGIGAFMPRLTQLPFKIVDTISYDPAAKDLTVEVSKAKASNADFLLLVCRLQDSIILRREMVKQ